MPNDNDKPDTTGTVVPVDTVDAIRARLKAEDSGKRVFVPQEQPEELEIDVEPEPISFIASLIDGSEVKYEGFLVATSVFAGFANQDGIIQGLVPMNQLRYIKPESQVDEDQVPF